MQEEFCLQPCWLFVIMNEFYTFKISEPLFFFPDLMRLQNSLLYALEVAVNGLDWMRLSYIDCCETSLLFCRWCQSGLFPNQAPILAVCARMMPNDLRRSRNIQMTWKSSGLRSPQSETGANVLQQKMNSFEIGRHALSLRRAGFVPLQRTVSANKEGERGGRSAEPLDWHKYTARSW